MLDESPVGVSVVGTPLAVPLPLALLLHPAPMATETTNAVKTIIFFMVWNSEKGGAGALR